MAASALPSVCPRCAAEARRVLSATAIATGRGGAGAGGGGRRRRGGGAEPSLVTVKDRRQPSRKIAIDPLRAPRRPHEGARPWMVGH